MVSVYALCQFINVVLCQFIYAIYYCLEYTDSGQRRTYVRVDFDFFYLKKWRVYNIQACQYTQECQYTGHLCLNISFAVASPSAVCNLMRFKL